MFLVNGELAPLQLTRDYRNQSKEKVAKWEWKQVLPHCNLHSWVKEGSVVDSSILETFKLEYSEEEYNTYLSNPNWSKEETDYLFHLCSEYNLRFPIIMDRYDQPIQRSMEDIKARYYQVCKKLAAVKTGMKDEKLAGYTFVESKEKLRKEHINKLLSRTPEQLLEEELLYHEIQMYQARRECWSRERDLLYKMVSHNKDATASLTEKSISLKRRKGALSRNKKDNLEDLIPKPEMPTSPIYLLSNRLACYKPSYQLKLKACLDEFGISPIQMPTSTVIEMHDLLLNSTALLIEARKQEERLTAEVRNAKILRDSIEIDATTGKPIKRPAGALNTPRESKRSRTN